MKEMALKKYTEIHGQAETGRKAGISQSAVSQMLKNDREVVVITDRRGRIRLEERKQLTEFRVAK